MRIRLVWLVNTAVLAASVAGCAQMGEPAAPAPIPAPKIGTLESAYDRAKWTWVRNADGRALLKHAEMRDCFVDPQPPLDVYDAGFTVKRGEKTIAATRYDVLTVYEQRDFWEAVYTRNGSQSPTLGVYAAGRCQDEAEAILAAYERESKK
jgi:hypothetical protein